MSKWELNQCCGKKMKHFLCVCVCVCVCVCGGIWKGVECAKLRKTELGRAILASHGKRQPPKTKVPGTDKILLSNHNQTHRQHQIIFKYFISFLRYPIFNLRIFSLGMNITGQLKKNNKYQNDKWIFSRYKLDRLIKVLILFIIFKS